MESLCHFVAEQANSAMMSHTLEPSRKSPPEEMLSLSPPLSTNLSITLVMVVA